MNRRQLLQLLGLAPVAKHVPMLPARKFESRFTAKLTHTMPPIVPGQSGQVLMTTSSGSVQWTLVDMGAHPARHSSFVVPCHHPRPFAR